MDPRGRLDGAPVRLYPFEMLPNRWMPGAILTFAGRKFDLNMLRRLLGTDVPLDRHFDLSDLTRRVGMRGGLKWLSAAWGFRGTLALRHFEDDKQWLSGIDFLAAVIRGSGRWLILWRTIGPMQRTFSPYEMGS